MCSMRVHAGGRALAHMPHAQGPGAVRQRGARRCLLAPKHRVSVPQQLPCFRPRNCQRFLRLTQGAPLRGQVRWRPAAAAAHGGGAPGLHAAGAGQGHHKEAQDHAPRAARRQAAAQGGAANSYLFLWGGNLP